MGGIGQSLHKLAAFFVGFELELDDTVASRFDVTGHAADARLISSATRVVAATGAFE